MYFSKKFFMIECDSKKKSAAQQKLRILDPIVHPTRKIPKPSLFFAWGGKDILKTKEMLRDEKKSERKCEFGKKNKAV